MLIPNKFSGYQRDGTRLLHISLGGGGGGGGPTTSTVQNTNLPEYAQPYVETMLGATQNQLFTGPGGGPLTKNAEGIYDIGGFKPYQAYGGTYDDRGNLLSYDPSKGIAGVNDMQRMAFAGMANTAAPTAGYNLANAAIEDAGRGAGTSATNAYNYGNMGVQAGQQGQGIGAFAAQDALNRANVAHNYAEEVGKSGFQYGAKGAGIGALAQQDALDRAGVIHNYAEEVGKSGFQFGGKGADIGVQGGAKYGDMGAQAGLQGQQSGLMGQNLGIQGGAQYGNMGVRSGLTGQNIGIQGGAQYGDLGAQYGAQGAAYGAQGANYGNLSSQIGRMGLQAQQTGQQIGNQAQNYAAQAAGAGQQYANQATNPNAMQSYMSPYMQNVVDVQNKEAARNSAIQGTQEQAQAVKAGAFGGSRDAIMRAERARNLATLQNQNQAQGLQSAYQQAQQAQQFGAGLNLQGLSGAQQGLGTALQGGQLGLSGIGTALQGQQGAMQGSGLGIQGAQAGMQGAGLGLQGVNTQLAGTAQGMQGAQIGLQGVDRQLAGTAQGMQGAQMAMQGAQVGLQGVDRQLAGTAQGMQGAQVGLSAVDRLVAAGQLAQQGANTGLAGTAQGMQGAQVGLSGVDRLISSGQLAQQGANTGLAGNAQGIQGAQVGLQGVNAAQAGYGLLGQQGMNLNNSLSQQQQNNINLNNAKMTMGNQAMAYDQSIKNQAMQDYANAQQYPLMQLGTMSNMLRGLPMQASTTQQYQAAPNPVSQLIGAAGAGANIYNAMKAEGGVIKGYAKGGIMSYDMGGEVESQLESMDEKGLAAQAKESSSPSIRKIAQRLLRERQMSKQSQAPDALGVQYQAAGVPSYKPGGIIAFAKGDEVPNPNPGLENNVYANETPTGGIMDAAPIVQAAPAAPVTQAAPAARAMQAAPAGPPRDVVQEATYQRDLATKQANRPTAEILQEMQAEREALGAGDNKARDEYRSQQMAERANMKDEQERQRSLRLAAFFAQWGSTPGPVLVAGMSALKNSIPDIIADEKDAKKARREADKIIYDIDEATRLEKLGMIDKATALKEKAAGHAQDFNKQLLTFQSQRESDIKAKEVAAIQATASNYTADKHLEGQKLHAQNARLDRLAARETANDNKIYSQYQTASQYEQRVISKIIDQATTNKQYLKDLEDIKIARMPATDAKGNFDPTKVPPSLRPSMEAAEARVADQQKVWDAQKEAAAEDTRLAYSRVKVRPENAAKGAPKDTTRDTPQAANPAVPLASGEFSAPTAAHINALKANPKQKAAFDAKFGPGAANEYLGK
jgi:hypothetical protein